MLSRSVLSSAALLALAVSALPAQAISNTSDPANWRVLPGDTFNGVAGALDGTARLLFGNYICSGTLLAGGQYVLTAAHCADDFANTGMTVDFGVVNDVPAITLNVVEAWVHPGWNGSLATGADIAIVKLETKVDIKGFKLSSTNDVGKTMLITGYGTTSTGDSTTSPGWNEWGYAHYGYNQADVTSNDFLDAFDGSGDNTYGEEYVFDFDVYNSSGRVYPRYNTLQRVANLTGNLWSSSVGLGENEAIIAGGDSGGGDFVWNGSEWLLSGVHSWGWNFCTGRVLPNCDFRPGATSSYGDLSGSTAVYSHIEWIESITGPIPEPGTYAMMLAGLAAIAGVARRRSA